MSIKYMEMVWAKDELKGGRLLLMLALADHANDAGECWPSQVHLAQKARLDERQVRRLIGALAKDGYLNIVERRADKGKKTKYHLFPERPDKMSGGKKTDKMSGRNSDILSGEKRTFCPPATGHFAHEKPDIFDTIPSHARSESPIEPSEGNDLSTSPDFWASALAELTLTLPSLAGKYLTGSRLEAAGTVNGIALYRVLVGPQAAVGLTWLTAQAGPAIRRTLTTILRHAVLVEIVATELEPTP